MLSKDAEHMANRYENSALQNMDLMENVGLIADRLVATCDPDTGNGGASLRGLLEQALIVAAEAQQQLTTQSERIAILETLSYRDELTGLLNRRGFNERLSHALAIAQRLDSTGVLTFIDLDNFKAINDSLGHQAGDEVLQHVASLLNDSVRAIDVAARLGGDEFAVILIHTSARHGRQRIKSLERAVNHSIVAFDSYQIPVRASFGVVAFDRTDDIASLITQADNEMYQKKHAKPLVLRPWLHRMV